MLNSLLITRWLIRWEPCRPSLLEIRLAAFWVSVSWPALIRAPKPSRPMVGCRRCRAACWAPAIVARTIALHGVDFDAGDRHRAGALDQLEAAGAGDVALARWSGRTSLR